MTLCAAWILLLTQVTLAIPLSWACDVYDMQDTDFDVFNLQVIVSNWNNTLKSLLFIIYQKQVIFKRNQAGMEHILGAILDSRCCYRNIVLFGNNLSKFYDSANQILFHCVRVYKPASPQGLWNGVKKSSEIGQYKKTLVSAFASFLTTGAKVLFLGGKLGATMAHGIFRTGSGFYVGWRTAWKV